MSHKNSLIAIFPFMLSSCYASMTTQSFTVLMSLNMFLPLIHNWYLTYDWTLLNLVISDRKMSVLVNDLWMLKSLCACSAAAAQGWTVSLSVCSPLSRRTSEPVPNLKPVEMRGIWCLAPAVAFSQSSPWESPLQRLTSRTGHLSTSTSTHRYSRKCKTPVCFHLVILSLLCAAYTIFSVFCVHLSYMWN